jgi:hypothetical protein
MEPAAAQARAWTQRTCVCTIGKLSAATGFWVCLGEGNYVAPPNKTNWRGLASTEEIAQFLSRSFSTARSSGLAVKQPS